MKQRMKWIGAHVSISGGVENAPLNAKKIGASAFGMFTKNQRQWQAKPLSSKSIEAFNKNCHALGYSMEQILVHDSYLINLGHPEKEALAKSRYAFVDEFRRCEQLGLKYLNFHPGSHLGQTSETACLSRIAESINRVLDKTSGVTAVIENTAGQGGYVGYRFEHFAEIIHQVDDKRRIGVCLDTCHAYAAGYDLRSKRGYAETMALFDRIVGKAFLRGMHLNDSMKERSSRVDRHAALGTGTLGKTAFQWIMNDSELNRKPLILETPDEVLWPEEIQWLNSLAMKNPAE
jgi:deoxyribonuclease-4